MCVCLCAAGGSDRRGGSVPNSQLLLLADGAVSLSLMLMDR